MNIKYLHLSPEGKDFIRRHEGLKLYVYDDKTGERFNINDPNHGNATVGYGHKLKSKGSENELKDYLAGKGIFSGKDKEIRVGQAETLLSDDIQIAEDAVKSLVSDKLWLTQTQYNAIVDFTFNVGKGKNEGHIHTGLAGSLFLTMLNKGKFDGSLMAHFHRPKSIMKSRRLDEITLFNKGAYQFHGKNMYKE